MDRCIKRSARDTPFNNRSLNKYKQCSVFKHQTLTRDIYASNPPINLARPFVNAASNAHTRYIFLQMHIERRKLAPGILHQTLIRDTSPPRNLSCSPPLALSGSHQYHLRKASFADIALSTQPRLGLSCSEQNGSRKGVARGAASLPTYLPTSRKKLNSFRSLVLHVRTCPIPIVVL